MGHGRFLLRNFSSKVTIGAGGREQKRERKRGKEPSCASFWPTFFWASEEKLSCLPLSVRQRYRETIRCCSSSRHSIPVLVSSSIYSTSRLPLLKLSVWLYSGRSCLASSILLGRIENGYEIGKLSLLSARRRRLSSANFICLHGSRLPPASSPCFRHWDRTIRWRLVVPRGIVLSSSGYFDVAAFLHLWCFAASQATSLDDGRKRSSATAGLVVIKDDVSVVSLLHNLFCVVLRFRRRQNERWNKTQNLPLLAEHPEIDTGDLLNIGR